MKVLVACEYSGIVRDAFIARGHNAISCDFYPTERPGPHFQGDVRLILDWGWDMMIAHPTCKYLANSGAKHLYIGMKKQNGLNLERYVNMLKGCEFFNVLKNANIPKIVVENPVIHGFALERVGKPTQSIQPYEHGHLESKRTCLWLKGVPPLKPTNNVYNEMMKLPKAEREKVHHMAPSENRWKDRSRTYEGIAAAFAAQWG